MRFGLMVAHCLSAIYYHLGRGGNVSRGVASSVVCPLTVVPNTDHWLLHRVLIRAVTISHFYYTIIVAKIFCDNNIITISIEYLQIKNTYNVISHIHL